MDSAESQWWYHLHLEPSNTIDHHGEAPQTPWDFIEIAHTLAKMAHAVVDLSGDPVPVPDGITERAADSVPDESCDLVLCRNASPDVSEVIGLLQPGGVLLVEHRSDDQHTLMDQQRAIVQAGFHVQRADTAPGAYMVQAQKPTESDPGRMDLHDLDSDPTPAVPEV